MYCFQSLLDFVLAHHHNLEALKKATISNILNLFALLLVTLAHPEALPFTIGFPEHYLQALTLSDNKKWKSLLSMLPCFNRKNTSKD